MSNAQDVPELNNPYIDGAALIRARRSSLARFTKLLARYRNQGIPDRDIVRAMAEAPGMVDAIGSGVRR
jgi:hypothetical protein